MNAAQAMGMHAAQLQTAIGDVHAVLRRAQAAGLDIPERAAVALNTLSALTVAWAANAQGYAAPDEAKALLGLAPLKPRLVLGAAPCGRSTDPETGDTTP